MHEGARRKLTPEQNRALTWLSTLKSHREPSTLEELADELGVNVSTIRRWRTKFGLDQAASEIARTQLFESLPDVYRVLAEKAETGSYLHVRLFLEIADGIRQQRSTSGCTKSRGVSRCRNEASGYGALYQRINVLYLCKHVLATRLVHECNKGVQGGQGPLG